MTWQAQNTSDNYLIRRNGTPIATQNETTFTELLNLGTYTYSVTTISSDGQQSIPAFATVEITMLGIDSIENKIRLFPNPVRNWLNINFEQPFNFVLYNDLGQRIREGKAEGNAVIDCLTLTKGLYILQIATETQVFTKKIIVY